MKRLFEEDGENPPVVVQILEACVNACQDAQKNTGEILALLPRIMSAFLGEQVPKMLIKLITGIINLF